jgi:hypothetical protein
MKISLRKDSEENAIIESELDGSICEAVDVKGRPGVRRRHSRIDR